MILRPDRRRRIRMKTPEERAEAEREVDLHKNRVHLTRPSKPEVPAVVVGLLGFLAGAIALQSFLGGGAGGRPGSPHPRNPLPPALTPR